MDQSRISVQRRGSDRFFSSWFLFWREVNRERAAKAEERADKMQQQLLQKEGDLSKGKALAEAIKVKATSVSSTVRILNIPGDNQVSALAQQSVNELAEFANKLFPSDSLRATN